MRCSAVRKNCHPCRGYASPTADGDHVCHMHREFFSAPRFLFKVIESNSSIFQTTDEYKWMVQALRAPSLAIPKKRAAFWEFAIKRLTEMEEGDSWHARERTLYIFKALLEAGILQPMDIKTLWRKSITRQLRVLQFCTATDGISRHYRQEMVLLLKPFLAGAKPGYTLAYLLSLMGSPHFDAGAADGWPAGGGRPAIPLDVSGAMWREVITYATELVDMSTFAGASAELFVKPVVEFHKKARPTSILLAPGMEEFIYETVRARQRKERELVASRIRPLKEGIMVAAWRPARVAAAAECGMDLDDL
jgi:hypothetical protein